MPATFPLQKLARFISVIGHPLLTISVLVVYLTHKELPLVQARWISVFIICGVTLPVTVRNFMKSRKGSYTNFDVSDRQQRRDFYPFAIILLSLVLLVFWVTKQPGSLVVNTLLFDIMVIVFLLCNLKVKASMHAGVNMYIAVILLHFSLLTGLLMLLFALAIAWSRIVLKCHSLLEVAIGVFIGLLFGFMGTLFL